MKRARSGCPRSRSMRGSRMRRAVEFSPSRLALARRRSGAERNVDSVRGVSGSGRNQTVSFRRSLAKTRRRSRDQEARAVASHVGRRGRAARTRSRVRFIAVSLATRGLFEPPGSESRRAVVPRTQVSVCEAYRCLPPCPEEPAVPWPCADFGVDHQDSTGNTARAGGRERPPPPVPRCRALKPRSHGRRIIEMLDAQTPSGLRAEVPSLDATV
jgi:hypothetical protein